MSDLIKLGHRDTKLKKPLLTQLNKIAEDPSIVGFTDQEIVEELNDSLKPEQRISYTTFKNWKNGTYIAESVEQEQLSAFLSIIKRIRRKQKAHHINAMLNDENAGTWQRRAWLLERKFPDLNLTQKVDHTSGGNALSNVRIVYPEKIEQAEEAEVIKESEE